MKKENKIFGILAIVLGAIALLGSWIPGINQISFLIAILALILGIVGLCINLKNKKLLAIIGTVLSVVSIAIALGSQMIYNQIQLFEIEPTKFGKLFTKTVAVKCCITITIYSHDLRHEIVSYC